MRLRTFAILVVVLAILGGLIALKNTQKQELSIVEQVRMLSLVPSDLRVSDVVRVELYAGGRPDRKVNLKHDADGWRVEDVFSAPGATETIYAYLESVAEVQGEFRATAADENDLAVYGLSEGTGFHVAGYAADDAELFNVIVGKTPKTKMVFVRRADSMDVYVADVNLKEEAGRYGDVAEVPARSDFWQNKEVIRLDRNAINSLDLSYPDKHLRLERQEIAQEAENEEGEAAPVQYRWQIVEGGTGGELKQGAVDALLKKLANINATSIVNPATPEKYALAPAAFTARIGLAGGEDIVLEGGRTLPRRIAFMTITSDDADTLYNVSRFDFEDVWPKGSDLFDLVPVEIPVENLNRIDLITPDMDILLEREGETWTVVAPNVPLATDEYSPGNLALAFEELVVDDYVDVGQDVGLEASDTTAVVYTNTGRSISIALGNESTNVEGRYAQIGTMATPIVLKTSTLEKIFVPLKDLFDLTLFNGLDEEAITRVEVQHGDQGFVLEDIGISWQVTAGEESFSADVDVIDDYTFGFAVMTATDFVLGTEREKGAMLGSVTIILRDGSTHAFEVEMEQDGRYPLSIQGHDDITFFVSEDTVNRVLPNALSMKPGWESAALEVAPAEIKTDDHAEHAH